MTSSGRYDLDDTCHKAFAGGASARLIAVLVWAGCIMMPLLGGAAVDGATGVQRPELWFPVGEEMTYRIYWGFIPVGESVVTTEWVEKDGRLLLVIRIVSKTNKVLSKIYPVEDTLESIIDPQTFLPVQFMKNMKEGDYRAHEVTRFDHAAGKARLTSITNGKIKEYEIESDTRDLISFMYYMRQFDMEPGRNMQQRVMADEDIYDITIEPLKYEDVKTVDGERIRSLKVEPKAEFNGLFVRKGRGWMWISQEGRRIVTKIAAEVPVANVKLLLDQVNMRDPEGNPEAVIVHDIPPPEPEQDMGGEESAIDEAVPVRR
jgi:hypothetical protein